MRLGVNAANGAHSPRAYRPVEDLVQDRATAQRADALSERQVEQVARAIADQVGASVDAVMQFLMENPGLLTGFSLEAMNRQEYDANKNIERREAAALANGRDHGTSADDHGAAFRREYQSDRYVHASDRTSALGAHLKQT